MHCIIEVEFLTHFCSDFLHVILFIYQFTLEKKDEKIEIKYYHSNFRKGRVESDQSVGSFF